MPNEENAAIVCVARSTVSSTSDSVRASPASITLTSSEERFYEKSFVSKRAAARGLQERTVEASSLSVLKGGISAKLRCACTTEKGTLI